MGSRCFEETFFVFKNLNFEVVDSSNTSQLILRAGPLDHNRVNIKYLKHTKTTQNIITRECVDVFVNIKRMNAQKKKQHQWANDSGSRSSSGVKSLVESKPTSGTHFGRTVEAKRASKRTTDQHTWAWEQEQSVTINEIATTTINVELDAVASRCDARVGFI